MSGVIKPESQCRGNYRTPTQTLIQHPTHFVAHSTTFIMRLINAETLAMSEFFGDGIPKFAILSHT